MKVKKKFLRPSTMKLLLFLLIGVVYLYFAGEDVCAAGLFFKLCYKSYGFPFPYLVTGDIGNASDYTSTLHLGSYFSKSGSFLFNPLAFLLNLMLIYLLSCLVAYPLSKRKNAGNQA